MGWGGGNAGSMKLKRVLMEVTTVFIALMFVVVAIQGVGSPTTQHLNEHTMVVNKENKSYIFSNPVNTSRQFSSNRGVHGTKANTIDITQSQNEIENSIAKLYLKSIEFNHRPTASIQSFEYFLGHNRVAKRYLRTLTSIEQNNYLSKENAPLKVSPMERAANSGHPFKYVNSSINTSQGTFYYHSILYKIKINGTKYEAWKVNVTTPTGKFIDPWVWVNINYYVYTAPIWLGGWSVTYEESDNFNVEFTGSAAQSFYNNWEGITTYGGYGIAAAGLIAIFTPIPVLAKAVGAALTLAGMGLIYESSTMTNYYQSTGYSYIHLDVVNNYYYPWDIDGGSLSSSIGLVGLNSAGGVYNFWYNVPLVYYAGIMGVGFSGSIATISHSFISEYGSGTQVWFN